MGKGNPGLFADLGKRVSDLLTKEFPSERQENKFAWKGQANNDVTIETSFLRRADGSILGSFAPKYKHKDWNTTFSADINTRKEVKAEVAVEDLLSVEGLKTTLTGLSKGSENFGTVAVEYKHELATVNASVDFGKAAGSTVKASAVIGSQGVALGASTEYFFGGESELKDLTTVLSYGSSEFDITAFGRIQSLNDEDRNELGATYFHKINADWQVGAEAVFEVANADSKPKLTFASQYQLHNDTLLKGKFDTAGRLGLSYQQKYNRNAKITIASTIDTNNLSGKNSSTFGFTLSLND
jgi:voltage-dependent anion channel protein 2